MTLQVLVIAVVRIVGSLPVLRWPLAGGLVVLVVDLSDLLLRDTLDLGGVPDYQSLDKWLDQVYLALFLVVALRWRAVERRVAVGLYLYRLVGFALFSLTGERALLLVFPNVFEPWFLLVAALHHRREPLRWTAPRLGLALAAVTVVKEVQEWALHGARLLDAYTIPTFFDAIWRWLTGAP